MPTGHGTNFEYFRYVDGAAANWSMRCDKAWGGLAASGFAAFNAADPLWPKSKRYRARQVLLQEATSTRVTRRPCGSSAATILTPGATVTTYARGSAGLETLVSLGQIAERKPKTKVINSLPDPTTA